MDLQQQIRDLQQKIESADRRRGQAEGQRQHAEAQLSQIAGQLHAEFGVPGLQEARALLAELERQAGAEVDKVRAALEAAAQQGG